MSENKLRQLIRKLLLITEKKEKKVKHRLTSMNKLDTFFEWAAPTIEDYYTRLRSSEDQRSSFRQHFLNGIVKRLGIENLQDIFDFIGSKKKDSNISSSLPRTEEEEKEELQEKLSLKIKIDSDGVLQKEPSDEELEADEEELKADEEEQKEKDSIEDFDEEEHIEGLDPIGRREGYEALNKIFDRLNRTREGLDTDNPDDTHQLDPNDPDSPKMTEKQIFTYYLLLNWELYFDAWEAEEFGTPGEDIENISLAAKKVAQETEPSVPDPENAPEGAGGEEELGMAGEEMPPEEEPAPAV